MHFWDWNSPMDIMRGLDISLFFFGPLFLATGLWTIYWKGMALWKAARESHLKWFIALLLINTLGILEILYIYKFSKKAAVTKIETSEADKK